MPGFFFDRANSCVEDCPSGTFGNPITNVCEPCRGNCKECKKEFDYHCTECPDNFSIILGAKNYCVPDNDCPEGTVA